MATIPEEKTEENPSQNPENTDITQVVKHNIVEQRRIMLYGTNEETRKL